MTRAEKEWEVYSGKYRTYIKTERGLAANTVEAYMRDLRRFRRFVTERYRLSPLEVETPVVEEFLNSLFEAGAEKSTQNRTLSGVSSFYDFLLRTDVLEKSPAEFVERPKSGHYLPDTLSIEEIDAILDAIDVSTAHGYRNRTMIEMLYSCGLRVSELTSLHISDLFFDEGFIRVLGKGSKQRLVPVSDRCRMQVETYLREGFQVLASFPGSGSMRYAPEAGKTVYVRAMPEWMGEVGSEDYQKALFDAAQWLAERTKGKITYWQVANEPDIDIFYGPLAGNPDAKPGINLGYINDYARLLMHPCSCNSAFGSL